MHKLHSPLTLLLLASPLLAQGSIVVPPSLANAPGSSSSAYPLGLTATSRVQYCYDATETGLSAPTVLKSMAIRAEEGSANVAKTMTMQIEMSTTLQAANALSTTFATNRGANHAIVFTAKSISLPATTTGFLGTWSPPMVYDTPFTYDPAAGNLLCEFEVPVVNTGAHSLDVCYTAAGRHFPVGAPCAGYTATSTGGGIGATLTYSCSAGTASAPAVLAIGASEYPVPIPLPGSPTCTVLTSLDVVLPVALSATGTGSIVFNVPSQKVFRGVSIFGQWVQINASTMLESTVERRVVLGDVYLVSRMYNLTSNTAATGSSQASVGIVMRFGT